MVLQATSAIHTDIPCVTIINMDGNQKPTVQNGTKKMSEDLRKASTRPSDIDVLRDSSGFQALLPPFLRRKFADKSLEKLYVAYLRQQKFEALTALIVLGLCFDIAMIIVYSLHHPKHKITEISLMGIAVLFNIGFFILLQMRRHAHNLKFIPFVLWCFVLTQLYIDIGLAYKPHSPSNGLPLQLFFVFTTFVMLPVDFWSCVILSGVSCLLYTVVVSVLAYNDSEFFYIWYQIAANILLCICATILGVVTYAFTDTKQRSAFLETKSSLGFKVIIEEEYRQQERLLLSVLPKHVADDMVKDFGADISGQFRKIYMSRHDDVSILFADMVGFTALSSKCTAKELVQLLNELFANFDGQARQLHQLRIKILGDCYYCICGAPERRSDHAVLAIHMGLGMVDSIADVRVKTNTDVMMRVGIHTGAILGGILGQKQWQYDVLGKEVTLANKMESGGLPDRVHISQQTKDFLKDEFELEPGHGDQREDALRLGNIKTYLVKSVLKPYPEGTQDEDGGADAMDLSDVEDTAEDEHSPAGSRDMTEDSPELHTKLYEVLMEKEETIHMSEVLNGLTLRFKDPVQEKRYAEKKEGYSGVGLAGICCIPLFCFLAQLLVLPRNAASFVTFAIGQSVVLVMAVITLAMNFPNAYPSSMVKFVTWVESSSFQRTIWAGIVLLIVASLDVVDRFSCDSSTLSYYASNISNVSSLEPRSDMFFL